MEPMTRGASQDYFAETAVGAVVMLSIQFLSLTILIVGLSLIGIAKLVARIARA